MAIEIFNDSGLNFEREYIFRANGKIVYGYYYAVSNNESRITLGQFVTYNGKHKTEAGRCRGIVIAIIGPNNTVRGKYILKVFFENDHFVSYISFDDLT